MECIKCDGRGWLYNLSGIDQGKCHSCNGSGEQIKEVCEWDNLLNGESTTKCGNLSVFMDTDFKYCPYCGKPISIKGE